MRTVLPLLRIVAVAAFAVAFVATWQATTKTGMPNPAGMDPDALWWYTHQDDIRQIGLVVLVVALVTMFVPFLLVTVAGAVAVGSYAVIVGESRVELEQAAAWWIFAGALVAVAGVRRFGRPRHMPPA
jgi:hypothetical protein